MDWIGLDWNGLDWIGLDWIGLDWIGLDWIGCDASAVGVRFGDRSNTQPTRLEHRHTCPSIALARDRTSWNDLSPTAKKAIELREGVMALAIVPG